jgi:AraC-like DNA-binding protein
MQSFIDTWYQKIRPYILKYKDGFFELPFIGNSPQLMWESFKKMPYCTFHAESNSISANNMFLEGIVYYHEAADGLIWIHSTLLFKQNVIFKQLFNQKIPVEYYCITCFTTKIQQENTKTILHDVYFDGQLWFTLKPKATVKNFHFKNTYIESVNIYFKKEWYDNYKKQHSDLTDKLDQFFQSDNEVITSNFKTNDTGYKLLSKAKQFMQANSPEAKDELLKDHIVDFMQFYKTECLQQIANENYFIISNSDRLKIIKAEELLHQFIHQKFPGIDYIAQQVLLSETKLKSLFKLVHGITLFDYYQNKKMIAAKEVLCNTGNQIADVASAFGYENGSKFAAAFKKHFNELPSQVSLQQNQKRS